jgi:type IV pilus assembly protein PilN
MSMVLINLLPHREEKRRQRKQAFFATLMLAALVGVLLVMLWFGLEQQRLSTQQARNTFLKEEITKLDAQIKDVASLKTEIEALKARQKAVEDLQTDRNMPVHLLTELVKQTPDGMFLNKIRQEGDFVMVNGVAQTNERVSEFLRNTAYHSPWLERPELQEIKAALVKLEDASKDAKEGKRLFEFSVKLALKRPLAAQEAASGASAAEVPASSAKAM